MDRRDFRGIGREGRARHLIQRPCEVFGCYV